MKIPVLYLHFPHAKLPQLHTSEFLKLNSFHKLLGLPQNWHNLKNPFSCLLSWSHDFLDSDLFSNFLIHIDGEFSKQTGKNAKVLHFWLELESEIPLRW